MFGAPIHLPDMAAVSTTSPRALNRQYLGFLEALGALDLTQGRESNSACNGTTLGPRGQGPRGPRASPRSARPKPRAARDGRIKHTGAHGRPSWHFFRWSEEFTHATNRAHTRFSAWPQSHGVIRFVQIVPKVYRSSKHLD